MPELDLNSLRLTVDFCIADVKIRVKAPSSILAVLNATLSKVPRFTAGISPELTITVLSRGEAWEIKSDDGGSKFLTAQSALPQVGGAVVTSAVGSVAIHREYATMRATVIEKDGRALAMIGDDWESAMIIAAHFHSRGWSYIGSDNALLNRLNREVFCIQKSLYVNSSAVAQLPLPYRPAVEASPWFATPQGISFYAVDPTGTGTGTGPTWTHSATLCAIVVVDGAIAVRPSLEIRDASQLGEECFSRLCLDWSLVRVSDLRIGKIVETCDLIEFWFDL